MTTLPGKEKQGAAAVDRALLIVSAIASRPQAQTLSEIARATGFYKSTTLRLLASLLDGGYVARRADDRYCLGLMAFRLGLAYERANPLSETVTPVLQALVAQGTESASFHVRQDIETRVCLIRVDSQHATLDTVRAGQVLPLHRGAAGRVLLAFDSEAGAEFDAIRNAGFALSLGERDPLCAGLAYPVFGPDEAPRGAVSLSGPRERFNDTAIEVMLPLLMHAAVAITRPLGGDVGRVGRTASVSPCTNLAE